jgi:hypothetical protein
LSASAPTRNFTTADSWPDGLFHPHNKAALAREAARRKVPPARLTVRIADYRTTVIRLVRRGGVCRLSLHARLAAAPADVFAAALRSVWNRLDGRRADPADAGRLADFIRAHPLPAGPPRPPGSGRGRFVDLEEICRSVNSRFFGGRADVAGIEWTPRRSRRRLADCHPESGVIRVSRLLDQPRVPRFYLEFLVYHELLHLVVPPVVRNGRRHFHHAAFRRLERQFPQYREAKEFQDSVLPSLARVSR